MRVTQKMMVKNVSFWLSQQAEKLSKTEKVVATGKQVNEPSDDPSAASRILKDRATISATGQYQSNISRAVTWIKASETVLDATDTLMREARNLTVEQGSGDLDSRENALTQLQSIYDQIIALANSRYGSGYMYSGYQTDCIPYALRVALSGGAAVELLFGMAEDASDVSIEIVDSAGDTVRTIELTGGATQGVHSVSWDGLDDGGNPLPDGEYDFMVAASDATGGSVASYPAYRGDSGGREVVIGPDSVIRLNNDGGEIFGDCIFALSRAITALQAADFDAGVMTSLEDSLSAEISRIEGERAALSNIYTQLNAADVRWDDWTMLIEEGLSEAEVGSDDQAVIELQVQETAYEITLETASTILKLPKLTDFL